MAPGIIRSFEDSVETFETDLLYIARVLFWSDKICSCQRISCYTFDICCTFLDNFEASNQHDCYNIRQLSNRNKLSMSLHSHLKLDFELLHADEQVTQ